jgi:imidazolonepropionase-like amidohydrolase
MRLAAVASLVALAPLALAWPEETAPPFAIKDARIVVKPGKTLEHATIVFRGGLVEAVGADVAPPPDAIVEDGRGLTVYPGFIDAGCAFPLEPSSAEAQRAREGARPDLQADPPIATPEARRKGIRAALDLAAAAFLDGDRRREERRAGFAAALAVPPHGFLAGKSALLALGERPRRSSVVQAPSFLHASLDPADGEWSYPHTLMGATAHVRQAFADALRQRELEERAAKKKPGPRPAFDPDLDALLPAVDRKLRVAFAADSEEDVRRALALATDLGLDLVVTDARRAAKAAPLLRSAHVPVILSLAWSPRPKPATLEPDPSPSERKGRTGKPLEGPFYSIRPALAEPAPIGPQARAAKPPAEKKDRIDPTEEPAAVFADRERKRDDEVRTLERFFQAGVPVAVSSLGLHGPAEVRERLREAIKAGLPEEAALAALTRDAALVLGLGDRLGTLERGKLAFATVMTGSLGDEKAHVRFTVVDGARLEAEKLDEDLRLARLAGRYRFDAVAVRGELVLEAFAGKLSARVVLESGKEVAISQVQFEGDRVKLSLPKDALPSEKKDVAIDALWIGPDALEGTATFSDGARTFRADRLPPRQGDDDAK